MGGTGGGIDDASDGADGGKLFTEANAVCWSGEKSIIQFCTVYLAVLLLIGRNRGPLVATRAPVQTVLDLQVLSCINRTLDLSTAAKSGTNQRSSPIKRE